MFIFSLTITSFFPNFWNIFHYRNAKLYCMLGRSPQVGFNGLIILVTYDALHIIYNKYKVSLKKSECPPKPFSLKLLTTCHVYVHINLVQKTR